MMARLFRFSVQLFAYLCLALVVGQVAVLASWATNGGFEPVRLNRLWAQILGVDRKAIRDQVQLEASQLQSSKHEGDRLQTLRDAAIRSGNERVRFLEAKLLQERQRYELMRTIFEVRLKEQEQLQKLSAQTMLKEVIESLDPAQAKELMVGFLKDDALEDVVTLFVQLTSDRQRKIFAEFRTPEETQLMNDVLLRIRSGGGTTAAAENQP